MVIHKIYIGFEALLRSADKSEMPGIEEISGEIAVSGKPLKKRFVEVFSRLQKLIKNFLIRRKICQC